MILSFETCIMEQEERKVSKKKEGKNSIGIFTHSFLVFEICEEQRWFLFVGTMHHFG